MRRDPAAVVGSTQSLVGKPHQKGEVLENYLENEGVEAPSTNPAFRRRARVSCARRQRRTKIGWLLLVAIGAGLVPLAFLSWPLGILLAPPAAIAGGVVPELLAATIR